MLAYHIYCISVHFLRGACLDMDDDCAGLPADSIQYEYLKYKGYIQVIDKEDRIVGGKAV